MTAEARRTLLFIRECIADDRYALSLHFMQRMEERGLFWPDVQAVIDHPKALRSAGLDTHQRPKWILRGKAATHDDIEVVCVLEIEETLFITLYWED